MSNNPKIIEIGGRQLHYVDQGEEGQQPIIFIHGGLDDYRCWQFQIDSFFQTNTVPSPIVEGLLILTNGLAMLSQIIPLKRC
jgi:pimeloyl-ACP methyl ester carboxylesterase